MSSYETLRYSLDNILKELDDICRSIDDLTDTEPKDNNNEDIKYYEKIIKNPSIHLSSFNKSSSLLLDSNKQEYKQHQQNADHTIYSNLDDDVYYRYNLSNFQQNKSKTTSDLKKYNYQQEQNNNNHSFDNSNTDNMFKKHKLPSADSKDLNTVIGSVRDSFLFKKLNKLPLATKLKLNGSTTTESNNISNDYENYENIKANYNNNNNNERARFDASKVRASPELARNLSSKLNQSVSINEQINIIKDESLEYEEDILDDDDDENELDEYSENIIYNSKTSPNRSINEDADFLNSNEISKIECFYNSMGCYVYVGKCIAELYQIKREDEFDAIDNDPVNDYKLYMENLNNKQSNNYLSKSKVNYTYINSGVPVIIFNYGANPKRDKDLRILLVERSTSFCMWQFKFDYLTQFDLSNRNTNLMRLTLDHNFHNLDMSQSPYLNHSQSMYAAASTSHSSINYQNEYFEKFFNSKNRHAHKEHLLKFVLRRDCDEFTLVLMKIMNDLRQSDRFTVKKETLNVDDVTTTTTSNGNEMINSFPTPLPPCPTSSSVVIYHTDSAYFDYSAVLTALATNTSDEETQSINNELNKLDQLLNEFENDSNNLEADYNNEIRPTTDAAATTTINKTKFRKVRKSDISSPLTFSHVSHLDKPVAIGKRYKLNYY